MKAFDILVARLAQPSTYAGFSGLALSLGYADAQFTAWATAAATLFSVIAVVLGEGQASA
jgi:hypothetical protein